MPDILPKIVVILGPTSSGKSSLAVEIAKKFNLPAATHATQAGGEIVSADSRQIYGGLDVGAGKIKPEEMRGIPHHMLDIVEPGQDFSVALYKEKAETVIDSILDRGKLPIVVGGTGFYIEAIVDGIVPPEVPPNSKLRQELEACSAEDLFDKLEKLDPNRADTIQKDNKRRLIRAIEVATALGNVPKRKPESKYDVLQIGLLPEREELKKKIRKRVKKRLEDGWIDEVVKLLQTGVPKSKLSEFGLGYKIIAGQLTVKNYYFFKKVIISKEVDREQLVSKISTAEWRYAKRQMTWFKRDERIKWFRPEERERIFETVKKFLGGKELYN